MRLSLYEVGTILLSGRVRFIGGASARLQRAPPPPRVVWPFAPSPPRVPVEDLDAGTRRSTLRFLYMHQNLFDCGWISTIDGAVDLRSNTSPRGAGSTW
jgi:hypothetical protein